MWTGTDGERRSWFVFGGNDAYVETSIAGDGERVSYFGRVAFNNKHGETTSSSSDSSDSSNEVTFTKTMVAFTEIASYPANRQCALAVATGFYHARGLELTSSSSVETGTLSRCTACTTARTASSTTPTIRASPRRRRAARTARRLIRSSTSRTAK